MLILTRKKGEGVLIGDDIEITVLETFDGRVKIGINAPSDIKILRTEVKERIIEENKSATQLVLSKDELAKLVQSDKK